MTVGIDLGTSNSLIGFWRDGAVTLVPNSLGRAHAVRRRDRRPPPKHFCLDESDGGLSLSGGRPGASRIPRASAVRFCAEHPEGSRMPSAFTPLAALQELTIVRLAAAADHRDQRLLDERRFLRRTHAERLPQQREVG